MKKRFISIKEEFSSLSLFERLFDIFTVLAMVTVTMISVIRKDDIMLILQLCLNIAASLSLFLTHFLFKTTSLFGSLSLRCQKYINIIVLIGSFGGQYFALGRYYSNYDTMTHLVTGSLVCFIGYYIYEFYAEEPAYKKPMLCSTYCYFISMTAALLWELFEFGSDFLLGSTCQGYNLGLKTDKFFYFRWFSLAQRPEMQYALYDTFADLFAAFITASVTAAVISAVLKKRHKTALTESRETVAENTLPV